MDPKFGLHLKLAPERRLIMTFALRQALEVLQMPQLELALWLKNEIELNPLLELDSPKSYELSLSKFRFEENANLASPTTLYENLMRQIREGFHIEEERRIAKKILDHLDEKGFIAPSFATVAEECGKSLSEIEGILFTLQTFDPPGICARNLQESLLLQLRGLGKGDSDAFQIIQNCFDDLLHSRFTVIKRKLGTSDLSSALRILARLYFRPAEQYRDEPAPLVLPDIQIIKNGEGWTVELNESEMPKFRILTQYLTLSPESQEEKEALRLFKASAKWLLRSLNRRRTLLYETARILVKKQQAYLDQSGPLASISIKELSDQLKTHESTLSRALAGKYAETPRGLIPLRSLVSSFPETETARGLLEKIVVSEDKQNPLTDDQLAKAVSLNGFDIARRTVAKYRKQLKIGSAAQRKNTSKRSV